MKAIIILILSLTTVSFNLSPAKASWLIDAGKFHMSAHMDNSCQDCHENIAGQALHPNPAHVNKKLTDFFSVDKCLSCHDDVLDKLDNGLHGAKRVTDPKKYSRCIQCHNPHYQPRLDDNRTGVDPSKPGHEQCGACHKERQALPALSPKDEACMACHRLVDSESPDKEEKITGLCLHCHAQKGTPAQKMTGKLVPLINVKEYDETPHAGMACTVCHPKAPAFKHDIQKPGDCRQCHLPHDEKVASDAHMGVACEACHLKGIEPVRDPESKIILWDRVHKTGEVSEIHRMVHPKEEASCLRCHFKGNRVGAVNMILPAKGILCMPCHAATFSVGDTTTMIALILFLAGFILTLSVWLTGSLPGQSTANSFCKFFMLLWIAVKALFSRKLILIIKAMFLDVFLQRRLFRQSRARWLIHSLIFLPFVFRFTWGFVALIASLWKPEWKPVWGMLDKNNPATAFLFDLTGVMVFLGVASAFIRGNLKRSNQMKGFPGQDRLALALIAGIVVIGFILEGMRIAMTGFPDGSPYAIAGYGISMLFLNTSGLPEVYGYIWYVHAVMTGAFFAYLPFSRLLHIILAPVVLALNAVAGHGHGRKKAASETLNN
jgi:nitrate reductase gamma subunit